MNDVRTQAPKSEDSLDQPRRSKFNFWKWFWLSTIPLSLAWLWHDFYAPANKIVWAKDYATAEQQAAKSGKPMILFFTGKWCSPCQIMKREVWADREVEATVNARYTPVMIDVNDPNAAMTLRRFHINVTPSTIITDPLGKELHQVRGGMSKTAFLKMLAKPNLSTAKPGP